MSLNDPPREMLGACRAGNHERVQELLDWGVDPRTRLDGHTLVHHAAVAAQHRSVRTLLRGGAEADREAFVAALRSGNRHCAIYIADDLFFRDHDPWAFSWAPLFSDKSFTATLTPEVAKWMVSNGLDTAETDNYGRSLAQLVRDQGRDDLADIFASGK